MIRTEALSVVFQSPDGKPIEALSKVTLTVKPGEFVVVFGPSGSGKSTLLLALGGLLRPTSGSVHLDGQSLYDLDAATRAGVRHRSLGFVFQLFHLVPYLSAIENVTVPMVLDGVGGREQRDRAREALSRFGLADRLGHYPSQLSVGQRQRVALARAMVTRPPVLLADEPTGNLDQGSGSEILRYLNEYHRAGNTVVLVTHDAQAASLADRIINLHEGRVQPAS